MKTPFDGPLMIAAALACITPMAATARGGRLALATSEADRSVVVVDLETEKVKILPTGMVPHAMAITPGGKIFVSNRGSTELTVINGMAAEVVGTVPLPATSFQLAVSPDGRTLAVAYRDALKLSLVDASTNAIVKTIEVGKPPEGDFKG